MPELDRLITARSEFHQALHSALERIAEQGCREVFLCDDDFDDWPLGDPAMIALLIAWAQGHRRFHVVARSFDGFVRRHPRWVAWRRQWSHVVQCRTVEQLEPGACPTLLVAPGVVALRLADRVHYRGRLTTQAVEIKLTRDQFDAVSQQSTDAFPATTLGL